MKKVFVLCLVALLLAGMTFGALADDGNTLSPFNQQAPTTESCETADGVSVETEITSFADRAELEEEEKAEMEQAYAEIQQAANVAELNEDLKAKAEELKTEVEDLAVSQLFHLDATITGEAKGPFHVSLKCEDLSNFVGLLHMENGQWVLVEDAKAEGNILSFTVDSFSPFAIVVSTESLPAPSGSSALIWVFAALAVAALAAAAFVLVKAKKKAA